MSISSYFYRRWFLDGRRHIVQDRGPRLVWQDDGELWGCDFAEQRPRRIRTHEGRSWDVRSRSLRPGARSYQYGRLRLWRTRPLAGDFKAWLGTPPPFDRAAIPAPRQRLGRWVAAGSHDGWPIACDNDA